MGHPRAAPSSRARGDRALSAAISPVDSPGVDTDEQATLQSAVADVLRRHGGSDRLRAAMAATPRPDRELWRTLTQQVGVAALPVPERFGGVGAGLLETHIVLEELGRELAAIPMLGSAVLRLLRRRQPAADEAVAAARMFCSETVTAVAGEAVQMHGGIGITWEHDIQLFFKRAHATTLLLNRPWTHAAAIEQAAGI